MWRARRSIVGMALLASATACGGGGGGLPAAVPAASTSSTSIPAPSTSIPSSSTSIPASSGTPDTASTAAVPEQTETVALPESNEVAGPSVPAWNGRSAAVSWTFDDAFESYLDVVVPYLDSLIRPATFYPGCEAILADADRWRDVSTRHEVGNRTVTNAEAGPDTDPAEITTCHEILEGLTGAAPSTFAYPGGVVDEPYRSYSAATYVAARGTGGEPPYVTADREPDWNDLPAHEVVPAAEDPDGTHVDLAVQTIRTAIAEGAWLPVVVHAVDEPGDSTVEFADLERMMAATNGADVWHATVADVATHDRVRRDLEQATPVVAEDGAQAWSWSVVPGMTDVGIAVDPGGGRVFQGLVPLEPNAQGFVEIDARLGSLVWIPA